MKVTLEDDGLVEIERNIPLVDSQGVDVYFQPSGAPRNPAPCFSLVHEMTPASTSLEPFSRTPSQ